MIFPPLFQHFLSSKRPMSPSDFITWDFSLIFCHAELICDLVFESNLGRKMLSPPLISQHFFSKTFPFEVNSRVQNWVSRPKDFRYPISSHVPNATFLKKMSEKSANNYILQKSQREISKNEVKNIRLWYN